MASSIESVTVRPSTADDLAAIADVHLLAFPHSVTTMLGRNAVRRYYDWLRDPVHDAVPLVAESEGRLLGFCIGGVFRGAMLGYLRRNMLFLTRTVVLHPGVALQSRFRSRAMSGLRLIMRVGKRALKQRFGALPSSQQAALPEPAFSILAIATDPRRRQSGVGRALMGAAEAEARRLGFRRMNLTVEASNTGAIRFYEALGWRQVETKAGWQGEMERWLESGAGHGHSSGA